MHIRENDTVKVISGVDRGVEAKVLKVLRTEGKVIVEGVARVYKHVRRSQKNPQGGRLSKEMPIQLAKVMLVCPSCGEAARTGARYLADGAKERFCKKCNAGSGQLAPARAAHAKK
ncbi:50S ribosomal protein L24 [Lignipirellula cremea]|uniref:Large ribosomal subunit protein uL24 n=1 Tax=Lignipirellula cremea TaxID=2528010 RepID=A0A518DMY1_9BACT|nr:50S ribosomal protein L24 [Lignipirellula cremea]QDU93198.1 50S ribosomal protein L24 [Lignipirellula cremea]